MEQQTQRERDENYMRRALNEALIALDKGEVPIGAVVVAANGAIVGRGHNLVENLCDATAHAELQAITAATSTLGGKYLNDCTLYVTVEPCPMCAGAIINSRIERVVYGAPDHKAGAFGTMINLTDYPLFKPQITSGILSNQCSEILTNFFKNKR